MISTALRHGADIKYICQQLNKAGGSIVSFSSAIGRTLNRYAPEDTFEMGCLECGSARVKMQEGCYTCLDCGSSKCG